MPDLTGAALKLCRAEEQAKQLNAEIVKFFSDDNNAHSISVHRNADATEWWAIWHINKLPPDTWPVLMGEIVHNLRSALDYLIYEFSAPGPNGEPLRGTAFPIFIDEPAYRSKGRSGGQYMIRGLSPEAKAIVERHQPFVYGYYADARDSYLWILHELSNADKHRLLNVATTYQIRTQATYQWEPSISGIEWASSASSGALEDGAEFFRIRVTGATLDTKMRVNCDQAFEILFDEGTPAAAGSPVEEILMMVGHWVGGMINTFAREL